MELSLRSLSKLKSEIEDLLANDLATGSTISIYETNLEDAIAEQRDVVLAAFADMDSLESINLAVSKMLDRQNVAVGITDLIAERTFLESRRDRLEQIATYNPVPLAHTRARVTKAKEDGYREYVYGARAGYVSADVLTEGDVTAAEQSLSAVKRRLREQSETLATLKVQTTVVLTSADAEFLRTRGLL